MIFGQGIEFLRRQHIKFAIDRYHRRISAWPVIEEGQAAKELATPEGGNMVQAVTGIDAVHDLHFTTAHQIQVAIHVTKIIDHVTRTTGALLHAGSQINQRIGLAALEEADFMQFQWRQGMIRLVDVSQQTVLHPLDGGLQ